MRKQNNEIKDYINIKIRANTGSWTYRKGENFGVPLQKLVGKYYEDNKDRYDSSTVEVNTAQNDERADVVITYTDGVVDGYEVKSCRDGKLGGVTICNSPRLLNDKKAFLINYTVGDDKVIVVLAVYETEIFRLTTINSNGKYKGCLKSTRDTGKKIKGRNFNDFINTSDEDDYTLEELTDPALIKKTILYYSVSKLIDDEYEFYEEEILEAIRQLKGN